MKIRDLMRASILASMIVPTWVIAQDSALAPEVACADRGFSYCQLPNLGENCSVGTCGSSLSSSGNCTIEAVYSSDHSSVSSCKVCSTEAINGAACTQLGGAVQS